MHLGPLLAIRCDDARQRACHHVFRGGKPQPPVLSGSHSLSCHLGAVQTHKHFLHVVEERATNLRKPRSVPWFAVKQVRAQFFFNVTDVPRDDGLSGSKP